jgi:O-antigen polymerase
LGGMLRERLRAVPSACKSSPVIVLALSVLGYKAVLDISYYLVIPWANYYALFPPQPDVMRVVESYVLLVPVIIAMPRERNRLSTPFLWLLVLVAYIPVLTIYAMRPSDRLFMYATCGFWVAVAFLARYGPNFDLPRFDPKRAWEILVGLYLALTLVALVVIAKYAGFSVVTNLARVGLDLSGAYVSRAEYVSAAVPLHGYYFYWLALVFNPMFFAIAALRRRWLFALLILVSETLIASFVGMRQYYVVLGFVVFVMLMVHRAPALRNLAVGFATVVVLSALFTISTGRPFGYLFFVGRFLMDAAQLSFFYYDFFSSHGVVPFGYFLKFYVHLPDPFNYPYAISPDLVVAKQYFHQNIAAVAGVVADAYMNLGWFGLVVWAAVLGLTLKVVDACSHGIDIRIGMAVLAMPALAIADTYFVRVFFATGLLWAFLALYLYTQASAARESSTASPHTEVGRMPAERSRSGGLE